MKLGPHWFTGDEPEDKTLVSRHPANPDYVKRVIDTETDTDEGRSEWFWIRLANGDLILGCYPQGETYLACEDDAFMG